jgi:hypothetical protein
MTASAGPPADAAELVTSLARAHIPARCLYVIAERGVADALGPDGAPPADLAARTGLDADALDRILRLVAAYGIFAHGPNGTYRHTSASELLRDDHPRSVRAYVRMGGMPAFWDRFTELDAAAQAGRPQQTMANLVDYYAAHPEESAIFNAAMVSKSRTVLPAVAAAYDFGPFATIADIGGGRGHLLRLVLDSALHARGVIFDLPHVIADSAPAARLSLAPGDFFTDPLPQADAYLLMDLLHDWDDAHAVRILRAVRAAAPPGARLLVIETLVSEAEGPHFGKTLDIIMLAVTGGRERTRTQHRTLLDASGFRLERVLPTASQYSIVEAVAV